MLSIAAVSDIERLRQISDGFPELEIAVSLAKGYPELLQAITVADKNNTALLTFSDDIYFTADCAQDIDELDGYLSFFGQGKRIIGASEAMEQLFPGQCENFYTNIFTQADGSYGIEVHRAETIDEYREIYPLLGLTISFEQYYTAVKHMERRGASRTCFIRVDGKIVSTAGTQMESGKSALISSVATEQEYRGRGLATELIKCMSAEMKREGKEKITISYMDEKAGRVYQKSGFQPYLLRKTVKLG